MTGWPFGPVGERSRTTAQGPEDLLVLDRGGLVGVDDHRADLNGMGLVGVLDLE